MSVTLLDAPGNCQDFGLAMPSFYLTYRHTLPYYPPHAEWT